MSYVTASIVQKADWIEELQKKVFNECALQSQSTSSFDNSISESSTSAATSTSPDLPNNARGDVPVAVIVRNIDKSFAQFPHFRFIFLRKSQRIDFLEELHKSLQHVARNNHVSWTQFRESSEQWFLKLINLVQQDGNNNVRLNPSEAPTEDSERDGLSVEEHSDAIDDDLNSCSMNQLDTVASCYSLNSSNMGFGTTDSMMESSEETDHTNDDVTGIDLKVRIRRFNEETADLRVDLLRAEETISTLESNIKSTQKALENKDIKYTRLRKENEEQKEMLDAAAQREESYTQNLRKLEKANSVLEKKVEELEKEVENVLSLKERIETLKKQKSELNMRLVDYKKKYDEKIVECRYLQEENDELKKKHCELKKSYEKDIENFSEKIEDLQTMNNELQSKMNKSDSSGSRLSITPPPYRYGNVHSTPYSHKNRAHDSLFSELKASGYNVDDAKIQGMKDELSYYNEEIAVMGQQLDEALQEIATARNEISVPNVQLVEMDGIYMLKNKLTSLLDLVKSSLATIKATTPPASMLPRMGEDSREKKPDVLPESTKTSYLSDDQLFGSEKIENDLVGSVTTSMTIADSKQYSKIDKSTSPLPETAVFNTKTPEDETREQEIIVPIVEALSRIIEIKGVDDEEITEPIDRLVQQSKQSVFTAKKSSSWMNLVAEASKSNKQTGTKQDEYVFVRGDGLHIDLMKKQQLFGSPKPIIDTSTAEMKTLKSECEDCNSSPDIRKLDTRFVTTRPAEKTYLLNQVVSSTEEKFTEILDPSKSLASQEASYFPTPLLSTSAIPRRKQSVYQRSFDVETLQTPDSAQNTNCEKRRSVSTPDVQESNYSGYKMGKNIQPIETPVTRNPFMMTYRCANSSDSSCSPSPKKNESSALGIDNESPMLLSNDITKSKPGPRSGKPVILAPKFKLPDSTMNQTHTIVPNQKNLVKTVEVQKFSQKNLSRDKTTNNNAADQSKILSSSSNLVRKEEIKSKGEMAPAIARTFAADSCNVGSSRLTNERSNSSIIDVVSSDNLTNSTDISNSAFTPNIDEKNNKTYSKNGAVVELKKITTTSSAPLAATVREESISLRCSSGANSGVDGSSSRAPAVVRAMSSGEDSSAESECDALRTLKKLTLETPVVVVEQKSEVEKKLADSSPVEKLEKKKKQSSPPLSSSMLDRSVIEVDSSEKPVLGRRRSNSCTDTATGNDIKFVTPPAVNGVDKNNSCQKVTSNSSPQESPKENETPKAFPSWTDERLQESGIASYPDMESEINENLSEEDLKKKYTSFSIGLNTDRMTLSKRMIISRRHRDQAEKNCKNELVKIHKDIKELPRQRNSVSGRVPGLRRPSLSCYETPKWEIEKLDRTDSSSSIAELRDIYEQTESRRHSREENNNNLIRTSINNLSTITSEYTEEEEVWSNTREDISEFANDNEINSLEFGQHHRYLICWLRNRYTIWKSMIWVIVIAFLLGIFLDRVVSSNQRNGPPLSWWSVEEIFNQYLQVENDEHLLPRPI